MNFSSPIQENEWIDKFLEENNKKIFIYNFKKDTTKYSSNIEEAYNKLFCQYCDYEIRIVDKSWYSKTAPLDIGKEIVKYLSSL